MRSLEWRHDSAVGAEVSVKSGRVGTTVSRAGFRKELVGVDGEMQLGVGPVGAGGGIRVPHVLHLDGLVFPVPGRYAFDVRVDGQHHASLPLTVYGPEASAMA